VLLQGGWGRENAGWWRGNVDWMGTLLNLDFAHGEN